MLRVTMIASTRTSAEESDERDGHCLLAGLRAHLMFGSCQRIWCFFFGGGKGAKAKIEWMNEGLCLMLPSRSSKKQTYTQSVTLTVLRCQVGRVTQHRQQQRQQPNYSEYFKWIVELFSSLVAYLSLYCFRSFVLDLMGERCFFFVFVEE